MERGYYGYPQPQRQCVIGFFDYEGGPIWFAVRICYTVLLFNCTALLEFPSRSPRS
jgi:hypothetical protein